MTGAPGRQWRPRAAIQACKGVQRLAGFEAARVVDELENPIHKVLEPLAPRQDMATVKVSEHPLWWKGWQLASSQQSRPGKDVPQVPELAVAPFDSAVRTRVKVPYVVQRHDATLAVRVTRWGDAEALRLSRYLGRCASCSEKDRCVGPASHGGRKALVSALTSAIWLHVEGQVGLRKQFHQMAQTCFTFSSI